MSDTIYIEGQCVNLPRGQKSHNRRHCGKNQTWRKGYYRRVKQTKKTLEHIEDNMKDELKALSSQRIINRCSDKDIAEAMNVCMVKFIDPVEEHIKRNMEYEVTEFPSPKTLALIQQKTKLGTECVIQGLARCGGDKEELRILVDKYVTERLSVPSLVSDMQKHIVDKRVERRTEFDDFVQRNRGSGYSSFSGGY